MELMEKEFTESKIQMIIKSLNLSKAPCPGSFSVHYYKKYHEILTPHLCSIVNDIQWGTSLLDQENKAFIHVIPKMGKRSWRLISLINLDLKIVMKILVIRLNYFLAHYIYTD